jgi:hypothetical protein
MRPLDLHGRLVPEARRADNGAVNSGAVGRRTPTIFTVSPRRASAMGVRGLRKSASAPTRPLSMPR